MFSRHYCNRITLNKIILNNKRNIHVEEKIVGLGLKLPTPNVPKGNFSNFVQIGNMVYLSGHLPQVIIIKKNNFNYNYYINIASRRTFNSR